MNKSTAFLLLFFISSCFFISAEGKEESGGLPQVLVSTGMIGNVVQEIAGDQIELTVLMGVGEDPHGYQATPRDMARAEEADLIFVNGFDLEENLLQTLREVSQSRIVEVSQGVNPIVGEEDHHESEEDHHESEEDHHEVDPHCWTSPLNVMIWVENIVEALSLLDPAHRDLYQSRGAQYLSKLETLHRESQQKLSVIEDSRRILITDHNSLGYFARDYGFQVKGTILPGFSTNSEITSRDLGGLIALMEKEQIPVIFLGNTAGDSIKKLSESIQREGDIPIQVLPLMTGSLNPSGEMGDSYLSYFEYNVNQILKGLGP